MLTLLDLLSDWITEEDGIVSVLSLPENIDLVAVVDIVAEQIVAQSETQETELDEETRYGHYSLIGQIDTEYHWARRSQFIYGLSS